MNIISNWNENKYKQNNNENDYLNTGNLCVVNKFIDLMWCDVLH